MHRLLIAAASAALLAAVAVPALADDTYPPCTTRDQDHCRVVVGGWGHHGHDHGHHHHHHHPKHK